VCSSTKDYATLMKIVGVEEMKEKQVVVIIEPALHNAFIYFSAAGAFGMFLRKKKCIWPILAKIKEYKKLSK
jgi:hypothetical protein